MEENFKESLKNIFSTVCDDGAKNDPIQLHPLVLAYIGDSIHNLYIRCYLVSKNLTNVNNLHKQSISYVSAHSQSDTIHSIFDKLTEREQYIMKRGRNAKSGTIPKNADVTEYKYATGFESLLGYLFLNNETDRLFEILKMSTEKAGDSNEK